MKFQFLLNMSIEFSGLVGGRHKYLFNGRIANLERSEDAEGYLNLQRIELWMYDLHNYLLNFTFNFLLWSYIKGGGNYYAFETTRK